MVDGHSLFSNKRQCLKIATLVETLEEEWLCRIINEEIKFIGARERTTGFPGFVWHINYDERIWDTLLMR